MLEGVTWRQSKRINCDKATTTVSSGSPLSLNQRTQLICGSACFAVYCTI